MWKAERFDPHQLMALYHKAGARYFVAQAMHHDHFFNYPSRLNSMNSQQVGPHKDILGLWKAAAQAYEMPFGFSEHLGATFSWWRYNKGSDSYGPYKGVPYDGSDPKWAAFYLNNTEHRLGDPDNLYPWYTGNKGFHAYWVNCLREVIDLYTPDLLYTDGALPFGLSEQDGGADQSSGVYAEGLEIVAHLYNTSALLHGKNQAVYTQKDRRPDVHLIGVLDIEKSQLNCIQQNPWQTDSCIGNWFYDAKQVYKRPDQIIDMLVDIISKNGNLLLNILQRPDGTIDDEANYILEELASWFAICGEAVHDTRPWKRFGEGGTLVTIDGFTEDKTTWTPADIRFTRKHNILYAFLMGGTMGGKTTIRSMNDGEHIRTVRLLGADERPYTRDNSILTVQMPETLPTQYVNVLAIEMD